MTQQWLTVLGLALDFLGFMLLLREWWLAFFNEDRQMQMDEQLDRMRAMRTMMPPRARASTTPTSRWSACRTSRRSARRAPSIARPWRRAGHVPARDGADHLGFVLQIVGAWPGCCPPWITP